MTLTQKTRPQHDQYRFYSAYLKGHQYCNIQYVPLCLATIEEASLRHYIAFKVYMYASTSDAMTYCFIWLRFRMSG